LGVVPGEKYVGEGNRKSYHRGSELTSRSVVWGGEKGNRGKGGRKRKRADGIREKTRGREGRLWGGATGIKKKVPTQ